MSLIIKNIDLPKEGEDITLEINHGGEMRVYSTELTETDTEAKAIQIPYDVEDIVNDIVENHELYRKGGRIV